jgi:predicted aminopeptidase
VNEVKPPEVKKYIIIVAGHTSNWDFPHGLLTRPLIHCETSGFLIKKSWVDSPIGFMMKWWRAIPVDRSKAKGSMVEQTVNQMNAREELGLCIAPEGSRSVGKEWKSGFYHIANSLQIPIFCVYFDYYRRETGIQKAFYPTGNMEADIQALKDSYSDKLPMYPAKSSVEHKKPTDFKRSFWFYTKPFVRISFLIGLIFLLCNLDLLAYGAGQAIGQVKVITQAEPVESFLNNPDFPTEKKEKIRLIQEIRQFTFDSLGLDRTESYTKMYDQNGKPLLWNVTACGAYELKAYKWDFPLLGSVGYKGFFDLEKAEKLESELKTEGFDTNLREVGGWSTLGILNDPILSEMLNRSEGSLANLICHELTHGTIFIKSGVPINENLASFVGDYGAIWFLKSKYGESSKEYLHYVNGKVDRDLFTNYSLQQAKKLSELYKSFDVALSNQEKEKRKIQFIQNFADGLSELPFKNEGYKKYFSEELPNNTFFMSRIRYKAKQNLFKKEFENDFNSDFPTYLVHLKGKYESIF